MFIELLAYNAIGLFLLRLAIGIVFFYHALPKLKNYQSLAQGMGMPAAGVLLLGLVELVSPFMLVLGIYLQLGALLLAIVMIGAIVMKIRNWHVPFSAFDKTGWEFDLILLAANLVILLGGGGSIGIQ